MFCLALLLVRSPQPIRSFAFTLMISRVIQSADGIIQVLATSQETVASGSFVNRNHFAGYLEMTLAVGIVMLAGGRRTHNEFSHWRDWLRSGSSFLLSEKAPLRIGIMIMALGLILSRSRMGNSAFMSSLTVAGLICLVLYSGTFRFRLSLLWVSILLWVLRCWEAISALKSWRIVLRRPPRRRSATGLISGIIYCPMYATFCLLVLASATFAEHLPHIITRQ